MASNRQGEFRILFLDQRSSEKSAIEAVAEDGQWAGCWPRLFAEGHLCPHPSASVTAGNSWKQPSALRILSLQKSCN
jgi:hypothetical protein